MICEHRDSRLAATDQFKAGGGEALAREMEVPFLERVPLDPQALVSGDDGTPLVQRFNDSPTAHSRLRSDRAPHAFPAFRRSRTPYATRNMNRAPLIQGLNEDLAAELGTVIRYTYQAAKCYGLLAAELRELLKGL